MQGVRIGSESSINQSKAYTILRFIDLHACLVCVTESKIHITIWTLKCSTDLYQRITL